jgi:hypothetical protein
MKSGNLNFLEPSLDYSRPVTGLHYLYLFTRFAVASCVWTHSIEHYTKTQAVCGSTADRVMRDKPIAVLLLCAFSRVVLNMWQWNTYLWLSYSDLLSYEAVYCGVWVGTKLHGFINRTTPCIVVVPKTLELNTLTTLYFTFKVRYRVFILVQTVTSCSAYSSIVAKLGAHDVVRALVSFVRLCFR